MRINAQVVKVADGFHLWSQTYDRDLTDIFAVQDEIAREVVKAMKVKLLAGKGPGEQRGTNPEAYAQFLLGNQLWRDAGNSGAMLAAYEKAVALDPTWAPAWARLASARATWVRGETRAGAAARHLRALEAAEKAVAIDPGLAVAYAVRGNLRMDYQWNWDGARPDFERAPRAGSRRRNRDEGVRKVVGLSGSWSRRGPPAAEGGRARSSPLDELVVAGGHLHQPRSARFGPKRHPACSGALELQ